MAGNYYDTQVKNSSSVTKSSENQSGSISLSHTVKGRYIRIYLVTYDSEHAFEYGYGQLKLTGVSIKLTRTLKSYTVAYDKNASTATGSVSSTSHKFMSASNISSGAYVGSGTYFTGWNTSANGSGVSMGVGASTGTSTSSNTFGSVVMSNLVNGNTTTTLYAQYTDIPFVFNGNSYAKWDNQPLTVLKGKTSYLSSTISGYTTTITYKSGSTTLSGAPTTVGEYTATINVKYGTQERGNVTISFSVLDGDFGSLSGVSGKWGSSTNPYVISTAQHLKNLSDIVNGASTALNSIAGSDGGAVTARYGSSNRYKIHQLLFCGDGGHRYERCFVCAYRQRGPRIISAECSTAGVGCGFSDTKTQQQ